ncbi:RNA 2',3'-cyclic phosphodiesterase [Marinilabilia salmonicolor]|jgi:2'-5' RNA ligase|uniref:RNA 2',3'-cyclic phosphodiesterase n=1 Tax=Marinilabilia salmonicolor TaxID=989 RepID=UPI000D06F955|nr:RNA 2',3'-cyclic phosphodiesterase [Marinilabilia salmonicolor]
MEKMRMFLGIGLDEIPSLKDWIAILQREGYGDQLRWTRPAQWHITVKFIGDFSVSEIPELAGKHRNGFSQNAGGQMVVEGAGFFGSLRSPKVLWAGVEKSDWLGGLNKIAENVCREAGIPISPKAFNPHLTLARIRNIKSPERLINEVEAHENTRWCQQQVQEVILYKSELTQDGPVYSVLDRFELKKKVDSQLH